jgi:hypothetical protein
MQEGTLDADQRSDAKPNEMTTARFDQLRSSFIIAPKRNDSLSTINDEPNFPRAFHAKLWYANRRRLLEPGCVFAAIREEIERRQVKEETSQTDGNLVN